MNVMQKDNFNYGDSVFSSSVIDTPESFVGGRLSKANNGVDSRISKPVQDVIIEEDEPIDMRKKKDS